jgi:hypothetical protein
MRQLPFHASGIGPIFVHFKFTAFLMAILES